MPRRGRKFVHEFLVPALDAERFGRRLQWVDPLRGTFRMLWHHKATNAWTEQDVQVFAAWDQRKGHYKPHQKEYYSKSKQRFRAILHKLIKSNILEELDTDDKNTRIFKLDTTNPPVQLEMVEESTLVVEDIIEDTERHWKIGDSTECEYLHSEKYISNNNVESVMEDHSYVTSQLTHTGNDHCEYLQHPKRNEDIETLNRVYESTVDISHLFGNALCQNNSILNLDEDAFYHNHDYKPATFISDDSSSDGISGNLENCLLNDPFLSILGPFLIENGR